MKDVFRFTGHKETLDAKRAKAVTIFFRILFAVSFLGLASCGSSLSLMEAVQKGDAAKVSQLLKKDIDVNNKDIYGWIPLMAAILNHDYDVARLLLDKGAAVNISDNLGRTPLALAVASQDEQMVQELLIKGANVGAGIGHMPPVPLLIATSRGQLGIVQLLLEKGVDPNARAYAKIELHLKALEDLPGIGLEWSSLPAHITNPFSELRKDSETSGRTLPDPNVSRYPPVSAYAYDQKGIRSGVLAYLLPQASPTALVYAIEKGFDEIAKVLIDHSGTDLTLMAQFIFDSLEVHVSGQHKEGLPIEGRGFVIHPTKGTPLNAAAYYGRTEIVRTILGKGVEPDARDEFGRTALINAIQMGHIEVVKVLIKHEANVNAKDFGIDEAIVKVHDGRADTQLIRSDGKIRSILMYAKEKDFPELLETLKVAGAKD